MSQLGYQDFNSYVKGHKRFDVWQPQFILTSSSARWLALHSGYWWVTAATIVPDLPVKVNFALTDRYGTGGNAGSGDPSAGGHARDRYEPADAFADDFSWGYRLAVRFDYGCFWRRRSFAGSCFSPLTLMASRRDQLGTSCRIAELDRRHDDYLPELMARRHQVHGVLWQRAIQPDGGSRLPVSGSPIYSNPGLN